MSLEQQAPDAFDPAVECQAWIRKPDVIGSPVHHHVCRQTAGHRDAADTQPGLHYLQRERMRAHRCTCGHRW